MKSNKRIVLAYSGGLDTSIILKWLQENYNAEVICYTADIGQKIDRKKIIKNAKKLGVKKILIKDDVAKILENELSKYSKFYKCLIKTNKADAFGRISNKVFEKCLGKTEGPIMAASDYMRMNSDQIRPYTNKSFYSLGADGFGRSDTRKNLRKFFEVDKEHLVAYGLSILAKEQLIASKHAKEAMKKYNIDSNKPIPTKL